MTGLEESKGGLMEDAEESSPAPLTRSFHRARSSLRMDPEEAAHIELENRQLRRRVAELEHALEDRCEEGKPPSQSQSKSKAPTQLLQALQDSSEDSDEEERRAEKRMKAIVVSGKWRKLAEGMRRLVREQDMDDIEAENEELKERVLHLEERLKQARAEAHRLQLQAQESLGVQNSYKDALIHAQQQVETAQMETDIQRRRVADLQEMLEQMELELSFAKMDTGPQPTKEVAVPETPELDGPRVGRLSVSEEADHLAAQLIQGPNQATSVTPETVQRAVRLIRHNLLMQRKLSGLLEWRSEVTVSKLQGEIDQEAKMAWRVKSGNLCERGQNEASLVQQLRAQRPKTGGKPYSAASPGQAEGSDGELEDLRLQCAKLERQLQKDADSARGEQARLRAELQERAGMMLLQEEKVASSIDEVQVLEMSLAEAWRAVRQESQAAETVREQSGVDQLEQQVLAQQHQCEELEIACASTSMAAAEAESTAARLREVEQELSQQCLTLKSEKAELMETLAKQDSGEGFASEATSLHAESLEAAMKVRLLVQENEALSLKSAQVEEQGQREAENWRARLEELQTRYSAVEAEARQAEMVREELRLKADELTSALVDLDTARKGQVMAEELAESLDRSCRELVVEHSTCQAELAEAKRQAEQALPLSPLSLPTLANDETSFGSTVAALRRARASLAGEALEKQVSQVEPSMPSSPPRDVTAGLKALQRLRAAAAGGGKAKPAEEASEGSQASSPSSGSKAITSLIANRSKASSLWLKAAQATGDSEAAD